MTNILGRWRPILDHPTRRDLQRRGRAAHFVATARGVMHLRSCGPADGQVVLLVHGGVVGGQAFADWQDPLEKAGFRVLLPDLLGYGYSDRPHLAYTRNFYIGQLADLLDALTVESRVHVVGASLGGTIATAFTARHPDRVASLALLAPSGAGRSRLVAPALTWPLLGDLVFSLAGPAILRKTIAGAHPPGPAHDDMTEWMREQTRYRGLAEGILNTIRHYDSTWQPDTNQVVGRTGTPTIAFWGSEDTVNPHAQAARLQQWIPQLQLVTLPGEGHAITYGRAESILATLIPFLLDASRVRTTMEVTR